MMATFIAASIIPSFASIAKDLGIKMQTATYLTTLQIAVLAGSPILWRPFIDRFGRRPVFLLSLVCSLAGNVGCAESHSYAAMAACRAIVAFFIAPPASLGSVVVAECFFKHERARYMGVWTLQVTVGGFLSPLLFGFVTQYVGYRWVFWILAIVSQCYSFGSITSSFFFVDIVYRPTAFNLSFTSSSVPRQDTWGRKQMGNQRFAANTLPSDVSILIHSHSTNSLNL